MKKLFILMTVLMSTSVFANNCYIYDSSSESTTTRNCKNIDVERQIDEGSTVFDEVSTKYYDGCLMSEYQGEILIREYSESTCMEALDEGFYVLGEIE